MRQRTTSVPKDKKMSCPYCPMFGLWKHFTQQLLLDQIHFKQKYPAPPAPPQIKPAPCSEQDTVHQSTHAAVTARCRVFWLLRRASDWKSRIPQGLLLASRQPSQSSAFRELASSLFVCCHLTSFTFVRIYKKNCSCLAAKLQFASPNLPEAMKFTSNMNEEKEKKEKWGMWFVWLYFNLLAKCSSSNLQAIPS